MQQLRLMLIWLDPQHRNPVLISGIQLDPVFSKVAIPSRSIDTLNRDIGTSLMWWIGGKLVACLLITASFLCSNPDIPQKPVLRIH